MNDVNKEKREFLRTKVKRLTSIVQHEGVYKLIEEDKISTPIPTNVKDISTGGLRIISEYELLKGSLIDLTIPDIGLRFRPPNTDYLKQLVELLKTD